jgi:predicted ATP-grasp superfamily ATP-dependent carboligase
MAPPQRKLAIVGASARAAAHSAIRAGFDVTTADLFADADLADACPATRITHYPAGLSDWLAASDCDAWMYTGAIENHPDLVDRMAALRPLLGNGGTALRDVRDPQKLQAALETAGVAFPETRTSADGLPRDGSWLCKTYRGASGSGVWRLDGAAALDRATREHAVFQQFIAGVPCAAVFAAGDGRAQLLGVTRQLLAADADRPWQYVGSIGPLPLAAEVQRQIDRLSQTVAATFQLRGLAGIDFVLAGERPWVVEVNPRYTASVEILERAAVVDALGMHVAACTGVSLAGELRASLASPPGAAPPIHGKTIVFASQPVQITSSFFDWARELAAQGPHPILADVPHAGEAIAAGRPILTVFAAGDGVDDCQRRLGERVAMVESRLGE